MARQRMSKDLVRRRYEELMMEFRNSTSAKIKLAEQVLDYYGIEG